MLPAVEVIVGTYTDFLLGYQLSENNGKVHLKASFADKSHAGSIRCVAVQGPWIASGGSDDRIFIYDMRTRKQSHILLSHQGTINALAFSPDLSHLLSGSDDGRMVATRVGAWTVEGDWPKPHAGKAITHIACHPGSSLALSLGGDQVLNTWNLVKGRVAYRTNLKSKPALGKAPECLTWSTNGSHFTLSGPLELEIWDIETANVSHRHKMPAKPICVAWINELNCLAGLENGNLAWVTLEEDSEPKYIEVHTSRVKGMAYLNEALATISSDGELKVWRCNVEERELELIVSFNINCRPICVGLLDTSFTSTAKEPAAKVNDEPAAQEEKEEAQSSAELELLKPRSFVSIEYEDETQPKHSQSKVTSTKAKPSKAVNEEASDSAQDSASQSDSDIDTESDDSDDSEPRPQFVKAAKRKATTGNKPKNKQIKKI
ncbi:CG9123 [Drosophila busckii]|uniref:CG9123 n=1 Tax=Drosophila busckii TaxID=30019 RepID=A0A0M4EK75_DROBS|nr:p21-activated protein kinase-interacting protein 1-like [Drosophila busckii]ALC49741.1 CG9123 [Drosophila busckii]